MSIGRVCCRLGEAFVGQTDRQIEEASKRVKKRATEPHCVQEYREFVYPDSAHEAHNDKEKRESHKWRKTKSREKEREREKQGKGTGGSRKIVLRHPEEGIRFRPLPSV